MSQIKGAIRPFCVAVDYDDTFAACPETFFEMLERSRQSA